MYTTLKKVHVNVEKIVRHVISMVQNWFS